MSEPNGGTPLSVPSVRFDLTITVPMGNLPEETVIHMTRFLPESRIGQEEAVVDLFRSFDVALRTALEARRNPPLPWG